MLPSSGRAFSTDNVYVIAVVIAPVAQLDRATAF
jgi:hypothetical protein